MLSKVAINRCKDAGVEVFEIGVEQARNMFGWRTSHKCYGLTRLFNRANCDTMRKGAYLLVLSASSFGCYFKAVELWGDGTLKDALDWYEYYVHENFEALRYTVNPFLNGFEVWHLVDDEELWGDWDTFAAAAGEHAETLRALAQLREASEASAFFPDTFAVLEAQTVKEDMEQASVKSPTHRHYYGLFCPYGVRTISDSDCAIRFETLEDLRQWIENDPYIDEIDATRERTTLDYIRRHKVPVEDAPSYYDRNLNLIRC